MLIDPPAPNTRKQSSVKVTSTILKASHNRQRPALSTAKHSTARTKVDSTISKLRAKVQNVTQGNGTNIAQRTIERTKTMLLNTPPNGRGNAQLIRTLMLHGRGLEKRNIRGQEGPENRDLPGCSVNLLTTLLSSSHNTRHRPDRCSANRTTAFRTDRVFTLGFK